MRGTLHDPLRHNGGDGIIPAYAGNTSFRLAAWTSPRDHPRVCGEHPNRRPIMRRKTGSSPRMRGTHHGVAVRGAELGIIPAYAGNTPCAIFPTCATKDHPRVCGEHLDLSTVASATQGSSPRMRGTPKASAWAPAAVGIIPAYAGNTSKWPG